MVLHGEANKTQFFNQKTKKSLNIPKQTDTLQTPTEEIINDLVNLFNKGQFSAVIEQSYTLTKKYPEITV